MSNPLSKITAALLAVVLLFLFPAVQTAQREEDLRVMTTYNMMVQFTDAVRNKGYLSPQMYNDFTWELSQIGGVYDLELEHRHKKYHPEYGDPADPATFKDGFSIVYDAFYTREMLQVLFPETPSAIDPNQRKYKLEAGDYMTVSLELRTASTLAVLSEYMSGLFAGNAGDRRLTYGGMVLNEDY